MSRTRNAWGRPIEPTPDGEASPRLKPRTRDAWGAPVQEAQRRDAWGDVVETRTRDAWGDVVETRQAPDAQRTRTPWGREIERPAPITETKPAPTPAQALTETKPRTPDPNAPTHSLTTLLKAGVRVRSFKLVRRRPDGTWQPAPGR